MGWAKYSEDNYEAFFERQALKGGNNDSLTLQHTAETQIQNKPKEENSFAEISNGKSCFLF